MNQKKKTGNPFGFVQEASDSLLGGIVPASPEEIQMLAKKRQEEKEAAAKILMQNQNPTTVVANPQMEQAAAAQEQAQAAKAQAVTTAAGQDMSSDTDAPRLAIDENGRLVQTTFGGKVMDAIFGQWLK